MIKEMNERVGKMDVWDIGLTKGTVVFGVLFILGIWPVAMEAVASVNPWWFLVGWVLLAVRPMSRFFG